MRCQRETVGAFGAVLAVCLLGAGGGIAQELAETDWRSVERGGGPYERLIIRGATLIDGTGAPKRGPVDIVVEGERIVEIRSVGSPGGGIDPDRRPTGATREIDARGDYVLPGFVDNHVHSGSRGDEPGIPDHLWSYRLWLAHGVTTVRGVALGDDLEWGLEQKRLSARNEIVAPRIFECAKRPGSEPEFQANDLMTPEAGRQWARYAAKKGADCLKLGDYAPGMMRPPIMEAILKEARELGLGTTAHLHQTGVAQMNALDMARAGLAGMTHFYGLFESMYEDRDIQPFSTGYNYADEQDRFGEVGEQWRMVPEPGSEEWNALIEAFLERDFFINPTMTIYEASRDVRRARTAPWHDVYTLPTHWEYFQPSYENHGSYYYYWTTHHEAAWKNFYERWMRFLDDYKDAGGRVTAGSDSCCIYKLHGFAYIRELELLQEAGFTPLEVIRAATLHGAQELHEPMGEPLEFGMVKPQMLADLVIVGKDPVENLKVLYGTGAVRLNEEAGRPERVGGIEYTVKGGIVYDARQLLEDAAQMVREEKARLGMDPEAPLQKTPLPHE